MASERARRAAQPELLWVLESGARFDAASDLFTTAALLRHFHDARFPQALCRITDLGLNDGGVVFARVRPFESTLLDGRELFDPACPVEERAVTEFDGVFLRVDPPITEMYRHALILLCTVERKHGPLFVNSPHTILTQGSKILVSRFTPWVSPTLITGSPAHARQFIEGRRWIAKPLDRASGVDVVRGAPGREDVLDHLVKQYGFVLAQEYQPLVETQGEFRHLVFDGEIIATYRKQPAHRDFRANADCGAIDLPVESEPGAEVYAVNAELQRIAPGVVFCSLDFIGTRLIEINFENPGGLPAADRLYWRSHAERIGTLLRQRLSKLRSQVEGTP